jgi:hypothetical protein
MAGLVPAIYVLFCRDHKDVDARHKAGHDEKQRRDQNKKAPAKPGPSISVNAGRSDQRE